MTAEGLKRLFELNQSLGSKLAVLQFHEAYHAGQLGLLRRIAGKKGAIQ